MDHAGEHYASCSDDGRVVVTGLYSDDNGVNFNMDRAVQSIAIDPIYSRANSGRRFMTGAGDKLVMHVMYKQYFTFHKRFAHHQHEIEDAIFINHHVSRTQLICGAK